MLTAEEVEAMPPNDVSRETLARLDKVESALNDDDGIRMRLRLLMEWTKTHEATDKDRHDAQLGAIGRVLDRLDRLDEREEESEEDRKQRRKAWAAALDPRVIIPILMALGAGAAGGYSGGTYYPPHEISEAMGIEDHPPAPRPRPAPAPASPPVDPGEVTE